MPASLVTFAHLVISLLNRSDELLRRAADRIGAFALDALANVGRLQHAHDLASDLADDLLRRAGGREHALPGADLVAGKPSSAMVGTSGR